MQLCKLMRSIMLYHNHNNPFLSLYFINNTLRASGVRVQEYDNMTNIRLHLNYYFNG